MSVYDLLVAWPALLLIAAGVLVIVAAWLTEPRQGRPPVRFRPGLYIAATWQPPAPTTRVFAGGSVFAETATVLGFWPVCANAIVAVVVERYGDSPADIAARWLREAADEQRKAVTP